MASTSYKLEEKINARIFDEEIEPVLRETVVSAGQKTPRLLMLGGQPGSGKTSRLRSPAAHELAVSGGFMAIDADQLRTFHPDWDSLNREDDMTAAVETHPDAAEWVNKAIALAIRERCHVIFDGTMGNSASAIDRIEQFEKAGYEIEVGCSPSIGVIAGWACFGVMSKRRQILVSDV